MQKENGTADNVATDDKTTTTSKTKTTSTTTSSKSKKSVNNNVIWVQGKSMESVSLSKLSEAGIGNVFLHEYAFTKYGKTKVLKWIKSASAKNIKVHIWIQTFYENGKWVNPVNTKTKTYNTDYFHKILSKIKTYSKMSKVAGIHLDYLRYPGNAYKYSYSNGVSGEKAITKFTKLAKKAMDSCKSNLILSAAVMPETSSDKKYYGQNIPALGKYLDVITPMIYKGNYGKNASWIKATSKWFAANSGGAKIWGGIQTYKSDNQASALSVSALKTDAKAVLNGGADGIALFRWGLTKLFNLLSL